MTGQWNPRVVQSATNLSLLEKIVFFVPSWNISTHQQRLHLISCDIWQVNLSHALYFLLCILPAWHILLHHGRLSAGERNQAGSPATALGNWAITCQFLRDLMLLKGVYLRVFWLLLARALFCTDHTNLVRKNPIRNFYGSFSCSAWTPGQCNLEKGAQILIINTGIPCSLRSISKLKPERRN